VQDGVLEPGEIMNRILITGIASLITLGACGGTSVGGGGGPVQGTCAQPIPRQLSVQPGIQQGFVVDACGNPLSSVQIVTRNAFASATDSPLTTNSSNGYYTQNIPPASVWETWAEINRDFDGDKYCNTVYPETPGSFGAKDGAVRNFVWRLDGERPDSAAGNRRYNGGGVIIDANRIVSAGVQGTQDSILTFIFRPVGPLVDGSTRQDFARQVPFKDIGNYNAPTINGFPLGKYELIVAITFPGDPANYQVYTRINTSGQPFTKSIVTKFSDIGKGSGDIACLSTPKLNLELSLTEGN
jgi:hypothetical protein